MLNICGPLRHTHLQIFLPLHMPVVANKCSNAKHLPQNNLTLSFLYTMTFTAWCKVHIRAHKSGRLE